MIKLCVLLALSCAGALAVTQEQLAQYVAAQQTAGVPKGAVLVPRPRQAYALQQAEDAGDDAYQTAGNAAYVKAGNAAYQQAYQAAYQQAASAYQPAPAAPQASSYKSFSSGAQAAPVYYRPAPAAPQYSAQAAPAPQQYRKLRPLAAEPDKEPEDYDPNPAYQFSFDVKDDEFTNYQNRKEQREGDKISGSYSVVDSDGYIRTVTYTADPKEGFKAEVSREPTEIKVRIPQPPAALPQQYQQIPQQLLRKQQTQQYLEASSPAAASPQYRPQSVAYVAPQYVASAAQPQYAPAAPQYVTKAAPAYAGQHRLAAPAKPKASAIGYAQQPTAGSPILYQAYQP